MFNVNIYIYIYIYILYKGNMQHIHTYYIYGLHTYIYIYTYYIHIWITCVQYMYIYNIYSICRNITHAHTYTHIYIYNPYPLKNGIWGGESYWNFILKFHLHTHIYVYIRTYIYVIRICNMYVCECVYTWWGHTQIRLHSSVDLCMYEHTCTGFSAHFCHLQVAVNHQNLHLVS